jgi:hypothetical protein
MLNRWGKAYSTHRDFKMPNTPTAQAVFKYLGTSGSNMWFEIVNSDNPELPQGIEFDSFPSVFRKAMTGKCKHVKVLVIDGVLHFEGSIKYQSVFRTHCWRPGK